MTTDDKLQMDIGVVKTQVQKMIELSAHCSDDRERIIFYMLSLLAVPQMHRSDYTIQLIAILINEIRRLENGR